jgi:hypothetical protein
MTATYNLVCPQATTFTFQFKVETDGVPWDLTNYTATMTVRPFSGSSTQTLVATTANGKIVLNVATATATVTFSATETNISAESYVYDFVFNSGSVITRLLEGKFLVAPGVTV